MNLSVALPDVVTINFWGSQKKIVTTKNKQLSIKILKSSHIFNNEKEKQVFLYGMYIFVQMCDPTILFLYIIVQCETSFMTTNDFA